MRTLDLIYKAKKKITIMLQTSTSLSFYGDNFTLINTFATNFVYFAFSTDVAP